MNDFSASKVNTIGIVGMGLIGGSYAKAYKEYSGAKVLGFNRSKQVIEQAVTDGALDGELTDENISECDLLILCLYPEAIIDFVTTRAGLIRKGALVLDAGGLKRNICGALFPIAAEHGFTFIGGHPMAGRHVSGYTYSTGELFKNSSMILVPKINEADENAIDEETLKRAEAALSPCQFGRITICSASAAPRNSSITWWTRSRACTADRASKSTTSILRSSSAR